jgi:short-subunit dehydrogenase
MPTLAVLLFAIHFCCVYHLLSKLAALGVAEALHSELKIANPASPGHVHVVTLCPGVVNTNLRTSSSELYNVEDEGRAGDRSSRTMTRFFKKQWDQTTMTPEFCAEKCLEHLESGKFFCILAEGSDDHPSVKQLLTARYNEMVSRRRSSSRM